MSDEISALASRVGLYPVVVLLGVACRLLFSAVRHTIRTILLHLCAASLFGGLAGIWAIEKQEFSGFMGYSMVGVISVLAIDVAPRLIIVPS